METERVYDKSLQLDTDIGNGVLLDGKSEIGHSRQHRPTLKRCSLSIPATSLKDQTILLTNLNCHIVTKRTSKQASYAFTQEHFTQVFHLQVCREASQKMKKLRQEKSILNNFHHQIQSNGNLNFFYFGGILWPLLILMHIFTRFLGTIHDSSVTKCPVDITI